MTTINDIFDIPTQVHQGDFVLRLTEGVTRPADTLRTYVVTPQLEICFDQTLGLIKSALDDKEYAWVKESAAVSQMWRSSRNKRGGAALVLPPGGLPVAAGPGRGTVLVPGLGRLPHLPPRTGGGAVRGLARVSGFGGGAASASPASARNAASAHPAALAQPHALSAHSHCGRLVRQLDPHRARPLLHLAMVLEPDLLALLLGGRGAHLRPVFVAFLLGHQLAAVDRLILSASAPGGEPCRDCQSEHQGGCQGRD